MSRAHSCNWLLNPLALGFAVALLAVPAKAALVVSNAATSNVSCSAEVCTATGRYAVLNAGELTAMLGSGDATVVSGSVADHIFVAVPLSWIGTSRLTLDAYRSIIVNRQVVVAGPGAVTFTTNDGGRDGTLSFTGKGSVAFWDLSSNLTIDGTSYTLVSNIDDLASGIAANSAGSFALAGDYRSTASYTASPVPTTFTGKFEGLGNRIFYLAIDDGTLGHLDGLFAKIGAGGSVRDIGLIKATIRGAGSSRVGMIAGESEGAIANSYSTGRIFDTSQVGYLGGLVGLNTGTIAGSHSEVAIRGGYNCESGGLVGASLASAISAITDSHATGAVSCGKVSYVGGLVGNNQGTINASSASGSAAAGYNSFVGGLVGLNSNNIIGSFATGAVSVTNTGNAGGLAGANAALGTVPAQVIDAYATGNVTGLTSHLGSLFGECCYNPQTLIARAYGTGTIGGAPRAAIGGVLGEDGQSAPFSDIYWDTDTTSVVNSAQGAGNVANDPGLMGLSDAQLKAELPAGFDPNVWGQSAGINNGYPYLRANPPPQ